jgi:hypothetical protein
MGDDYSRLREPIFYAVVAAAMLIWGTKDENMPDWLRLFLITVGAIFAFAASVTALDFVTRRVAARMEDLSLAKTAGPRMLAAALKGLSAAQTDFVGRMSAVTISGIVSSQGPAWALRGAVCDIPLEFADDFLTASEETAPYLWPERRAGEIGGESGWANARQYCVELTNLLTANGWAERAVGPYAAKLSADVTLEHLRVYLGVAQ